jgi:photosystem II stability/assembly factor-like uncharacterized protein
VAVGGFGTILRTSDAGASWRTASSPPTNARLMAVTFLTPTVGIAVGTVPATILRTADGGATWTEVTPNTITQPLWSVATIDSNRALAVGDGGGYASNDGGVTWMAVPAGIGTQLVAVSFADASRGAVIAGDATVRRTSDGGATWVAVNNLAKLPFGTGIALKGTNGVTVGFGMSSNNVTFGGLQTTADAAATLVTDSVPIYPLRGVAMPSASVAVVVGENGVIMIRSSGN